MEALEGVVVGELKDLSHQIVKGKRTKRQRLSSPIPFTLSSAHLSGAEGGGDSSNEDNITAENNNINIGDGDDNNKNKNNSTNLRLSPAGSSDDANSTTTEDEDAARLLILLSQGNSRESSTRIDYLDHNYSPPSAKFTSKKYIETSSNANGKSGMFVYECKTCNRTFPSFQALGGHRASHRKPKNLYISELRKRPFSSVFSDDYDYDFDPSPSSFARNNNHVSLATPISYHHSMMNKAVTSPKIHECSYCGAEFTSGQALGGHMRRHRGSNGNNNSNYNYKNISNQNNPNNPNNNVNTVQPMLALSPSLMSSLSMDQDSLGNKKQKGHSDKKDALSLSLSLDLNLPAPPPAENAQKNQESSGFEYVAEKRISPSPEKRNEQQQQHQTDNKEPELLLAITPTLVDCQY